MLYRVGKNMSATSLDIFYLFISHNDDLFVKLSTLCQCIFFQFLSLLSQFFFYLSYLPNFGKRHVMQSPASTRFPFQKLNPIQQLWIE